MRSRRAESFKFVEDLLGKPFTYPTIRSGFGIRTPVGSLIDKVVPNSRGDVLEWAEIWAEKIIVMAETLDECLETNDSAHCLSDNINRG